MAWTAMVRGDGMNAVENSHYGTMHMVPGVEPINRKRILADIRLHQKEPVAFGKALALF